MCGAFQIYRIDKCIIWLVTTVLPLSSSGTVTGCCTPKIINSNPSSELRKADSESECFAFCLCIESHRSSDSCCFMACLSCFYKILFPPTPNWVTENFNCFRQNSFIWNFILYEILESQFIIFFLLLSTRCFSPILLKYISGRLSIRAFLIFTLSDLLSVSTYTGFRF